MEPISVRPAASSAWRYARAAVDAWRGETIRMDGRLALRVPGPRAIRLAVVGGNLRIHRLLDAVVAEGATVVDVGANVGYNTLYAACLAGPRGRVIAVEPAPDNVAVLERNVAAAALSNVVVAAVAAGRAHGAADLYLRGDTSAVNSLFPESCYAKVTDVLRVPVAPLDDLVDGRADVVKIDVEGAELDVLDGMARLARNPRLALIVEWHPVLQSMAGHAADALPRRLLERGWQLHAASHLSVRPLASADLPRLTDRLTRASRPVELLARRAARRVEFSP
ncbi:MAG TPA: FkbM family methyltransferase [Gammaproteobacteria bacterium]